MVKEIISRVKNKITQVFGLDLRSLAFLRVGVAVMGLADLFLRARDFTALYTDSGVFSHATLLSMVPTFFNSWWPIRFVSGSWQVELVIFILCAVSFVSLLVGYKTRWSTLCAWFFLLLIQARNPLIFQKSDDILRLILLWGYFLPWGKMYSLDAGQVPPVKKQIFSVATIAYFVQIGVIYVTAALLKTSPVWRKEGSAIWYALSSDHYTSALGYWFLSLPGWFLQFMTHSVWWFELLGIFLLIIPFFNPLFRIIGIVSIICLHIGFGTTMHLQTFPWICSVAMLAFIPGVVWEKLYQWLPFKKQQEFKLYYDDACGFCKKSVVIFKTFLFLPDMEFLPAQQNPEVFKEMEEKNSWILAHGTQHFYRFDGFIALLSASPVFWPLEKVASTKIIKKFGEKLYIFISRRRTRTCKVILPHQKSILQVYFFIALQVVAAVFLIIVLAWNINNVANSSIKLPKVLTLIAHDFRLDQKWDMFAPYPFTASYWFVMPGKLKDNSTVNIFNSGKPVSWEKPKSISNSYPDSRWRNYIMQFFNKRNSKLYSPYGKYMCQQWNGSHIGAKKLLSFQIYAMWRTNSFNKPAQPYKKILLWKQNCN